MVFVVVSCHISCIASLGLRGMWKKERWIRCVKRVSKEKRPWYPYRSDRVCSEHFVDGIPTEKNPDPTVNMGYELPKQPTPRRSLVKQQLPKKPKLKASSSSSNEGPELETVASISSVLFHESGSDLCMKEHDIRCESCKVKSATILVL